MKTFFIALILTFFSFIPKVEAQQKAKQYCELFFEYKNSSRFEGNAKISLGEIKTEQALLIYTTLDQIKQVESFKELPTILNYMSKSGWTLNTVFPVSIPLLNNSYSQSVRILFSKEIDMVPNK